MNLRGVSYDWDKEHGGQHAVGFIGEEIGKYYPEIVVFDKESPDPSYYVTGMDYSKMTPVLLQAIKELKIEKDSKDKEQDERFIEQQKQIDELKAEIERLKSSR